MNVIAEGTLTGIGIGCMVYAVGSVIFLTHAVITAPKIEPPRQITRADVDCMPPNTVYLKAGSYITPPYLSDIVEWCGFTRQFEDAGTFLRDPANADRSCAVWENFVCTDTLVSLGQCYSHNSNRIADVGSKCPSR
jgi:hypothetical protein